MPGYRAYRRAVAKKAEKVTLHHAPKRGLLAKVAYGVWRGQRTYLYNNSNLRPISAVLGVLVIVVCLVLVFYLSS